MSKNKLQEYFQKRKLPLPKYYSYSEGRSHESLWKSTVELYNGSKYTGDPCKSKTLAEASAANIALLDHMDRKDKVLISEDIMISILVDIENKPNFVDDVLEKIDLNKCNIDLYIFISEGHHNIGKEWDNNKVFKQVIPSTRKDAADIGMILFTGKLISNNDYDKIIVVTSDHFGIVIEECTSRVKHVRDIDGLLGYLSTL